MRDEETADREAAALAARLQNGDIPTVTAPAALAPGDVCHFVAPVRFGRRRADQYGHLMLTAGWLTFRSTPSMSIAWDDVADARRDGREIVISFDGSRRLLRFACPSAADAARGGVIARHLVHSARLRTLDLLAERHASV